MIKAGETLIESTDTEWGVEYIEPFFSVAETITVLADNELDARKLAMTLNGKVVSRTVMITAWEGVK